MKTIIFMLIMACILLIVIVAGSYALIMSIIDLSPIDQSAVCAVLEKHVTNREPQVIDGECTMLVGVGDVRVRMPVVEYGGMIMEDEGYHRPPSLLSHAARTYRHRPAADGGAAGGVGVRGANWIGD